MVRCKAYLEQVSVSMPIVFTLFKVYLSTKSSNLLNKSFNNLTSFLGVTLPDISVNPTMSAMIEKKGVK